MGLSLIGHYFQYGYPMPPNEYYLKRVSLYYDKIAIPDFNFYATQYSNFFNEKALEDWLEDLATKYYRFDKWINAGMVEFADSRPIRKDRSPFIKAHIIDCKDEMYHSTLSNLYKKHKMIYHVEFLARIDESLLSNNYKKALKESRGVTNIYQITNWFMTQATIDSLNFALWDAWNNNKIPTTDNPIAEGLLCYKLKRVIKKSNDPTRILSNILDLTVPHFDKLSFEQILKIREEYGDALNKFRKEIDKINKIINQETENQHEKIKYIVQNEIYPQIVEIRKIQLNLQPKIQLGNMLLKGLLGRIPYIDLLIEPIEAIQTYRKQRELKKHSFYLLSLL